MITPSDSPSSPSDYAAVAVQPMDIQAPTQDLSSATAAAEALSGPGGPRQAQTEALIQSAPGYSDFNITAGYSGGGESWPNDPGPADGD